MKKYLPYLLGLCCISHCWCVQAVIYKGKDPQGKTIYSDQPLPNGEVVEVQSLPTYTPPPLPQSANPPSAATQEKDYQIQIIEPINEQTFTTDVQQITVRIGLMPELKAEDSIRLMLNNQPYGSQEKSLNFSFNQLPRGSYQLQAQVIGPNGAVKATSETITFYQQRATVNRNNLNLAPQAPQGPHLAN